jgi:hypothetical protein
MILSLLFFENEFLNIVAISFTALVVNELLMVALQIDSWYVRSASNFFPTSPILSASIVDHCNLIARPPVNICFRWFECSPLSLLLPGR